MTGILAFLLDVCSWLLILAGSAVTLTGGIGLLRLPDVFARTHAASLTDTLGAVLLLVGMGLQAWTPGGDGPVLMVLVKLVLVTLLVLVTGPVATHALARAALHGGMRPLLRDNGEQSTPTRFVTTGSRDEQRGSDT